MPPSVLYPLCSWRDLAVCCAVLRSLLLRWPCGLTVIVIVLLTRFCTCSAMGPLCHQYYISYQYRDYCEVMSEERFQLSPVRCKDNQVCCKRYRIRYRNPHNLENALSKCKEPIYCQKEIPGPSYCRMEKPFWNGDIKMLECLHHCQDDECGMSFQFPGRYKLHFQFMMFTGISSLGPLLEKKEEKDPNEAPTSSDVREGFQSVLLESPEKFGCLIGVVEEPADQNRIRFVVQLMVYEHYNTSRFLDDLKANWNKRLMAPERRKFTNMIDFQLPVSYVPYDFTLPCPEVEDERQGIRTRWLHAFPVGQDVHELCSQKSGFNPQKFAVRTCQKDGKWSDDVDVTRCASKDKLPQGEDGDAEDARQEDREESSGLGRVPVVLIGVGIGLATAAIVVGLACWKLKDSSSSQDNSSSQNVAVEGQQPPEQPADGEDIESREESKPKSEAKTEPKQFSSGYSGFRHPESDSIVFTKNPKN